ncbi:hypothetical protein ACOSQ2_020718 [Xanthoceras sorbifolium]
MNDKPPPTKKHQKHFSYYSNFCFLPPPPLSQQLQQQQLCPGVFVFTFWGKIKIKRREREKKLQNPPSFFFFCFWKTEDKPQHTCCSLFLLVLTSFCEGKKGEAKDVSEVGDDS